MTSPSVKSESVQATETAHIRAAAASGRGLPGHHVESVRRVLVVQVDRGRHNTFADRQHGRDGLHRAGSTDQVAESALGRGDPPDGRRAGWRSHDVDVVDVRRGQGPRCAARRSPHCSARCGRGRGAVMWWASLLTPTLVNQAYTLAPRAAADRARSSTIRPAPSPSAKPLRSTTNGGTPPAERRSSCSSTWPARNRPSRAG